MVIRLNTMLIGHTGVEKSVVTALQALLNKGITPLVPSRGTVGEADIDILVIPPETEARQIDRLRRLRAERDGEAAASALARLRAAAATDENLIPVLVDCARAYCTEGEIVGALREVFGEYTESPQF